jgi:hypothetical protein
MHRLSEEVLYERHDVGEADLLGAVVHGGLVVVGSVVFLS